MGSQGQKRRKTQKKKPQHLAKVGSKTENERLLHEERSDVLANMGMRNAPGWLRILFVILIVLLVGGAIYSLLLLTVFH